MKQKIMCIFIAAVMVIGVLPCQIYASEELSDDKEKELDYI